jgi:hypothetical protein
MIKDEIIILYISNTLLTCGKGRDIEPVVERLQAPRNALAGERFFVNHSQRNHYLADRPRSRPVVSFGGALTYSAEGQVSRLWWRTINSYWVADRMMLRFSRV